MKLFDSVDQGNPVIKGMHKHYGQRSGMKLRYCRNHREHLFRGILGRKRSWVE